MRTLPEALTWYGLAAFTAGDIAHAPMRWPMSFWSDSVRRSVHTRGHAYAAEGDGPPWPRRLGRRACHVTNDLAAAGRPEPGASFCLLSATALSLRRGGPTPDWRVAPHRYRRSTARAPRRRLGAGSGDASVLLPKVMAGDAEAADNSGLTRLRARATALGSLIGYGTLPILMPAVALTMLERWEEFATGCSPGSMGSPLAARGWPRRWPRRSARRKPQPMAVHLRPTSSSTPSATSGSASSFASGQNR